MCVTAQEVSTLELSSSTCKYQCADYYIKLSSIRYSVHWDKEYVSTNTVTFQIESNNQLLSGSKDRAQMTANTALSLSLIVVLKELIDHGPEKKKYFYVSIVLVCVSLVLQVCTE